MWIDLLDRLAKGSILIAWRYWQGHNIIVLSRSFDLNRSMSLIMLLWENDESLVIMI